MMNITYAALHVRAETEKNNIFMQRRPYIDEAHTALGIFRFAVFFNMVIIFEAIDIYRLSSQPLVQLHHFVVHKQSPVIVYIVQRGKHRIAKAKEQLQM